MVPVLVVPLPETLPRVNEPSVARLPVEVSRLSWLDWELSLTSNVPPELVMIGPLVLPIWNPVLLTTVLAMPRNRAVEVPSSSLPLGRSSLCSPAPADPPQEVVLLLS